MGMRAIGAAAPSPYAFSELHPGSKALLIAGGVAAAGGTGKALVEGVSGDDEERPTHRYRRRKRN